MQSISDWLATTAFHTFLATHSWPFPLAETLHFMGLTLLFGAILIVDLRGLGFLRAIPFREVHKLVPVAIGAFAVNLLTGILFIFAEPTMYFNNLLFQAKMGLILLAGLNAMAFELVVFRPYLAGQPTDSGVAVKVISGASILIWTLVIIAGRSIPYVE